MSLGDTDLNTPSDRKVAPSLQLSDFRGSRYPNPFFDLAQQYMPPTIKELFRWCTFYYYNSPLIGATMKKVSRYPVTDLVFEDPQESTREMWEIILNKEIKMKERCIEINLDYHVYGNAFVSVHLPFTRFLICRSCKVSQPIRNWDWTFRGSDYMFGGKCPSCSTNGPVDVKDVPYKDRRGIRLIRWNADNMHIKFNEYTGRTIYMYSVPPKLRNMILRGDKDILEDTPLIVIEALQKRRMIRFHPDSIFHLKAPTLAEQDQGWGKPAIIHVLKDMYYFYTLRRAQEAIAAEHILPLDVLYPLPNAQQDPYIHTDLANWRMQVESILRRHRRDPNFKAVVPVPLGNMRVGGDGKMLMLSPELQYLNQTIVGGLGMSAEMLFGNGQLYSGASIQLRMMENDFIQNRSQLVDMILWVKDKIKTWMRYPNIKDIRFTDFRMADDIQRNQQLIGLNANGKVSDQTMLTELGYDWEEESQKMMRETQVKNYLMDIQTKAQARSQGEAMIIQAKYQQTLNSSMGGGMPPEGAGAMAGGQGQAAGAEMPQDPLHQKIDIWAQKLIQVDQPTAQSTMTELKTRMPDIAAAIEQRMQQMQAETSGVNGPGQGVPEAQTAPPGGPTNMPGQVSTAVNMTPMPEQRAPRRQGVM